ncbi:MAG TPA: hydrolase [Kofleriaceae bacterium]|nr:hydrolase [Kofleriaceae bacterium]
MTPLLDPTNCVVLLVDYQPQMVFGVRSIDGQTLVNNTVGLAKAARLFAVPTIVTTVAATTFSGALLPQLREVLPEHDPIDRTTMNPWEDARIVDRVAGSRRAKLVIAGLWTEVCVALPALHALSEGYQVHVVADACGGTSDLAHQLALERIGQAGGVPLTWLQFMLELQRDWARSATYDGVMAIAKQHAGTYGAGIQYAKAILGAGAGEGGR